MKRRIVAVLTGIMVLTLAGCGGSAGTADTTDNTAAAAAETAAVEEAAPEETAAVEEKASEETDKPEETASEETAGAEDAGTSASGALPAYRYPGDDALNAAIYNYIVDQYSKEYEKTDVSIPCVLEVYSDKSNDDDIQIYVETWIDNYDLDGSTLKFQSGGEYPGIIHIKKDGDTCTVTKMELIDEESNWTESAKKLFGTHFDDFLKIKDDTAARDKTRAQIIKDYAVANNLNITEFQDYGWDPVKLP